ncbi:hypothetical protein M758_8G170300 [Ceratodon purpureus]|nr:hypothetical protein M758_8G170300 [Ceratodon purpureus]
MMMRGRSGGMAWRRMRAAMVAVMLMVVVCMGCGMGMVASARPMSGGTIEQRGGLSGTFATWSEGEEGWRRSSPETTSTTATTTAGSSHEDGGGFFAGDNGGEVDPVWDAETEVESPPAQRQRDRSLWGMSKRLVPTGPNPLHN